MPLKTRESELQSPLNRQSKRDKLFTFFATPKQRPKNNLFPEVR